MKKIFDHLANDWYKYLLELIVITAGVLGAFMLNSWKENLELEAKETELLLEIRDNLEKDIETMNERMETQLDLINSIEQLIMHLEAGKPYHDSLNNDFFRPIMLEFYSVTNGGFESLLSQGLHFIDSKSIRKAVNEYYTVSTTNFNEVLQAFNGAAYSGSVSDFYKHNFRRVSSFGYQPIDYDKIIKSQFYLNYLYERKAFKAGYYISGSKRLTEECQGIIEIINLELDKKGDNKP